MGNGYKNKEEKGIKTIQARDLLHLSPACNLLPLRDITYFSKAIFKA